MTKSLVTGMGIVSPLGVDYNEHVKNMFNSNSGISLNSFSNKNYKYNSFVGKILNKVDVPYEYKDSYKNLVYSLSAAIQAIKMSNLTFKDKKIAITFGTSLGGKVEGEKDLYRYDNKNFTKNKKRAKHKSLQNIIDELLKYFNIESSVFVISTACSASNNAVILGSQLLQSNEYDLVLAGGSDELADISLAGFASLGAINTNGPANPYKDGSGISLGEGAGFVVLENEINAKNKKIYAEIVNGMISSDAYHVTSPDPKGEGANYVIDESLRQSGLKIKDIDYINGHGTGTSANDQMEYKLLSKKFSDNTFISSTKGQTGHTLGAAGIIETINIIAMINEKKVVGTINQNKEKNNYLNNKIDKKFLVNKVVKKNINYAINLSFAFGGNNSCSIIAKPGCFDQKISKYPGIDKYSILGYNSTLSKNGELLDPSKSNKYNQLEEYSEEKFMGYEYIDFELNEHLNRRKYNRIDKFSQMVLKCVAKTFANSRIDYKKIDPKEIGLIFSTPTGAIKTVESIERSILNIGYNKVSASTFPYTVLNAAAGVISENFKIKGPTSVISSTGTGFIDAIEYANQFCINYQLKYILIVNANQISKYELFSLSEIEFNKKVNNTDFVSSLLLSNENKNGIKFVDFKQIKGANIDNISLIKYINNLLLKHNLSNNDINSIIVNGNFKTNTKNELSSLDFNNLFKLDFMKDFNFSTQGSGEELIYLLSNYNKHGFYLIAAQSPFGGYSLLMIQMKK